MAGRLKTKVRGIVGLGIIGGVVGFVTGAIWGVASSVVGSGVFLDPDYLRFVLGMALGNAIGFLKIGGFTAAGFGALLAAVDSRRSLDELPLWRMGLLGGLVGASFPPIYVVSKMGFSAYWSAAPNLWPVMGGLGVAGAILASSMVAVAKRANRRELASPGDSPGVFPRLRGAPAEDDLHG